MEEIDLKLTAVDLQRRITSIGSIIRDKRKAAGITQQTLAFYVLGDKCMISNLERGAYRNVTVHTLIKISTVLDIDIRELFS